ncbi:hypothetical protein K8353_48655, partial [Burkholderia contaminans]|nr:hypothetical protein [Burkholderia contaminans]
MQERLGSWFSKTQNLLNEVTLPLVKYGRPRKPDSGKGPDTEELGEIFMAEQTIDVRTPNGSFGLAAI